MLKESAGFISAHPLPEGVRKKRQQFWAKQANEPKSPAPAVAAAQGSPDMKQAAVFFDRDNTLIVT